MPTNISRATFRRRRTRQRGMVTVVVMLFLIATVVFALSQMLNISSANLIDGQRQGDSTAAFFLAESGLEKGRASLTAALAGAVSNSSCTGIATNYSLGLGTVAISGTSNPPSCTGGGCLDCTVTAVGQVGITKRELTWQQALTTRNGVFCNGPVTNNCLNTPTVTWQLNLVNTSAYDGLAIFNLAYTAKGNNAATCAVASNCQLQFDLGSPSSGQNSSGLMGNSVNIPAGTNYPIYQIMDRPDRALVEVGAIFKGATAAPTLTGTSGAGRASYWNSGNSGTIGSTADTAGATNDGTETAPGSCTSTTGNSGQSCTDWCYGGDTLVMSYAAKVGGLVDVLTSATFGNGTGGSQSVALAAVAQYPSALASGAPTDVRAEVWYASNPNLVGSSPLALNASSYKGRGTGAYGARWTDTTSISGTTLTVGSSFTGYPNQIISIGDSVSWSGGGGGGSPTCNGTVCGTIVAQVTSNETSGALGGKGTYTISSSQSVGVGNGNRLWTVASTVLNVSACTICFFQAADPLNSPVSGRTITAQVTPLGTVATRGRAEVNGGVGRYTSTPATFVQAGPNAIVQAGTPGSTIYIPATSNLPAVTTPAMRIAKKTGTGVLANNSTVSSVSTAGSPNAVTRSFALNAAPSTPLDDVTLCAGTCAFFVAGTTTPFTIVKSGGTQEWATAFTCLKGVDVVPDPVTSSSSATNRWTEVVR